MVGAINVGRLGNVELGHVPGMTRAEKVRVPGIRLRCLFRLAAPRGQGSNGRIGRSRIGFSLASLRPRQARAPQARARQARISRLKVRTLRARAPRPWTKQARVSSTRSCQSSSLARGPRTLGLEVSMGSILQALSSTSLGRIRSSFPTFSSTSSSLTTSNVTSLSSH